MLDINHISGLSGIVMKKAFAAFVVGTLVLGGLACWALWDLVAWTVPDLLLTGFALLTIGFAISL